MADSVGSIDGSRDCVPRRNPSSLLHDFIRSFQIPHASMSSNDVAHLKDFILSCDIIAGISDELYLDLLCFLADNWRDCCAEASMLNIPIFKFTDQYGRVRLCSIEASVNRSCKLCISSDTLNSHWLSLWNTELKGASNLFFITESTQNALEQFPNREKICSWMREDAGIVEISVFDFSHAVLCTLQNTGDVDLVIGFTHFLQQSLSKNYLTEEFASVLCESMPVVDKCGRVIKARNETLLPASVSKWVELTGTNLWKQGSYIELGEDYFRRGSYGDEHTEERQLLYFLERCIGALDVPKLCPPDAVLAVASSPMSKDNALLLLEWIHRATISGFDFPERFLGCIREGKWLRTSLGYKSPPESFLCTPKWGSLLQVGSIIEDIPLVDEKFYGTKIFAYLKELEFFGLVSDVRQCCLYIAHRLMSAASTSTLTKVRVFSLLKFFRYLSENKIAYEEIRRCFQREAWVKTSKGFRSPIESIIYSSKWDAFQQISDLAFLDEAYYGKEIRLYEDELKLLGVQTELGKSYGLIIENFRLPTVLSTLTVDSSFLILECIRYPNLSPSFIVTIREQEWIKTNQGYRSPKECFLYDPGWGCLLQWANAPVVDEPYYGENIRSYIDELGISGVSISFEDASKNIARRVKSCLGSSINKEASVALLECCKHLRMNGHPLCGELKDCISNEKWLNTSLGYRSPCDSAINGSGWEPLSQIAELPFIDTSYYGQIIYSYLDDLDTIGVSVRYHKAFQLVAAGFKFPKRKSALTAAVLISLLECIKYQLSEFPDKPLPAEFLRRARGKKWLKTSMGFRSPATSFLYDSEWEAVLKREDAPFLDDSFYGPDIASYWKELSSIGIRVRVGSGCGLLSECLICHTDFSAIVRIYDYLYNYNWEPEAAEKSDRWIWIPNEKYETGEWVSSKDCVLHVLDHAPSSTIKVLERYYEKNLLPFFSTAFGVRSYPK